MRYSSAILAGGAVTAVQATSAFCSDAVQDLVGNFFCPGAVKQIIYDGLDIAGSYREVSTMSNDGTCTYETKDYSGPIAPYDEGLSMHFRGPLELLNVAVYHPTSSSSKKREAAPKASHSKRHGHGHQHLHKKHHEEAKRADMVTAVIDGVTQTWENDWFGGATSTADSSTGYATAAAVAATSEKTSDDSSSSKTDSSSSSTASIAAGDFERTAYYCADDGTADGLTFLANVGDSSVSGTWDTTWGSSLAYVSDDGSSCASSPTVLKKTTLTDGQEIAIFSDNECDDSCGTVRPDSVAYKGFEGSTKVFIAEFTMPDTGKTADGTNMPAFWMLNAKIPRTGQYTSCSCWEGDNSSPNEGGCGELDVVELLTPGATRAKSTFHFANGVGDSHYFDRPTESSMKVAVVLDASSSTVSIKVLGDDFSFPTSLTSDDVNAMVQEESDVSLFSLMSFAA
ncbi:TOS1 protein [Xylariaceae sp. FL0016]|nr:TOS1 protein [Xylariaceae sp. FL0016]